MAERKDVSRLDAEQQLENAVAVDRAGAADANFDKARRKLLKLAVYAVPAVTATVAVRSAWAQVPSCGPSACGPNTCGPNLCEPICAPNGGCAPASCGPFPCGPHSCGPGGCGPSGSP